MTRTSTYRFWQNSVGTWHWRLVARNGECVGSGEGHPTRANVKRAIESHRRCAERALVVELHDDTDPTIQHTPHEGADHDQP